MEKSPTVQGLHRGTAILKQLADAIDVAGGSPEEDLTRLISDEHALGEAARAIVASVICHHGDFWEYDLDGLTTPLEATFANLEERQPGVKEAMRTLFRPESFTTLREIKGAVFEVRRPVTISKELGSTISAPFRLFDRNPPLARTFAELTTLIILVRAMWNSSGNQGMCHVRPDWAPLFKPGSHATRELAVIAPQAAFMFQNQRQVPAIFGGQTKIRIGGVPCDKPIDTSKFAGVYVLTSK